MLGLIVIGTSPAVFAQNSNPCADEQPYDYKTKLKGGYRIVFKTRKELKYLFLYKGNHRVREIADASCGLLHKNLGYVGADFRDYFVLVHSFGSGNPHEIELIKKTSGKNVLKKDVFWIGASEEMEILLYCRVGVPSQRDGMTLLRMRTGKRNFFRFLRKRFGEPAALIRIEKVTFEKARLSIRFNTNGVDLTRIYKF
jgi:hypothetical protein